MKRILGLFLLFPVFAQAQTNWGDTTDGGSDFVLNASRCMGGLWNPGQNEQLDSVSVWIDSPTGSDVRVAVYQGGSSGSGPGETSNEATLIEDLGIAASPSVSGFVTVSSGSNPTMTNNTPTWICVKTNDGPTMAYQATNSGTDWYTVGRHNSGISNDETTAYPATFPTEAASYNSGFHYTMYLTTSSIGGEYDTAPTVASQTTTAYTVTGSLDAAGDVYGVACHKDQTAPTISQVTAADCTGDVNAEANDSDSPASGAFDFSLTLTPTTAFPIFDIYVTDGTTLTTLADEFLDAPSDCGNTGADACEFTLLTSVGIGSPFAIADLDYDAQTANFAVGEVVTGGTSTATGTILADTDAGATGTLQLHILTGTFQNNELITGSGVGSADVNGTASFYFAAADVVESPTVTSPGDYEITIGADGQLSYDDGGEGLEQRAWNMAVYDTSAEIFHATDVDFVDNATAPDCSNLGITIFDQNVAATTVELDGQCTASDVEDTITFTTTTGTLPTGLTLSSPDIDGTPTVEDESGEALTFTATDLASDTDTVTATFYVVDTWTMPNCISGTVAACETAVDAVAAWYGGVSISSSVDCTSAEAAGDIDSTSPVAGEVDDPLQAITAIVSALACGRNTSKIQIGPYIRP